MSWKKNLSSTLLTEFFPERKQVTEGDDLCSFQSIHLEGRHPELWTLLLGLFIHNEKHEQKRNTLPPNQPILIVQEINLRVQDN